MTGVGRRWTSAFGLGSLIRLEPLDVRVQRVLGTQELGAHGLEGGDRPQGFG